MNESVFSERANPFFAQLQLLNSFYNAQKPDSVLSRLYPSLPVFLGYYCNGFPISIRESARGTFIDCLNFRIASSCNPTSGYYENKMYRNGSARRDLLFSTKIIMIKPSEILVVKFEPSFYENTDITCTTIGIDLDTLQFNWLQGNDVVIPKGRTIIPSPPILAPTSDAEAYDSAYPYL